MSLPREWSVQDSRGSLFRSYGTTTTQELDTPTRHQSDCPIQFDEAETVKTALVDCNTAGSMFSIHSAPPVPLADLANLQITNSLLEFDVSGTDSPRRPASLAIDSQLQCHSTKTIAVFQHQHSEIEEDDNENLLTVSSLTARPLIAKSRELRSSKLAERFKRKKRTPADPLDGGYGWFVVLGAFFVQFWVAGLVKSYGVLFVEILETFPTSSTAVASWIPAILSALCLALAPLSSALCQKFSCRSVVFVGGLFCTFGLTLSYFATSLYHLLFTFGILTGIGGGLSTTPGIIIVSLYFDKHRALANGICVSGTAAGSFVFPTLIEHLVHNFGFHGTILILGGCMLHVCACAALYRPLETISDGSTTSNSSKSPDNGSRVIASSGLTTNTTYIGSVDEPTNKKYIEHLFLEESKNRINDYYNTNKFVGANDKAIQIDSDDEDKDIIGETKFTKPIKSIRSSSLLHSVEDLSTDSTCVYKARSGFDSNRGSRRRNKNTCSTDEILAKIPPANAFHSAIQSSACRGLSKSMIIPTPVSDFSGYDECVKKNNRKTFCDWIKQYLDISLLKDTKFIAMCLSVTLMSTGCPYMLYFLPAYALSADFTKSEAGLFVATSALLDLIGRLGLGYLSDLQIFDRKKAYIVCILGAGTAVLLIPSAKSWYLMGCASAAYGLCLGCWYLLMPVLLADLFGTERISSSYGLVRLFQSIGAISVPPLAGFLRDLSGGYEICFYCMGTCMVLGSVPLLISSVLHDSSETTQENEESTVS
ncbi:uncharacterized protein LOC119071889 [Bradysia coprophila]|uniref:uncharacterized protein LOC119071889 n=1 Tax=Bradysia coprophila TaxID=38358 RepID=UPI00187D8DAB|nr:uncharacterized protein LOC119071889 [Bradysia coprophila]